MTSLAQRLRVGGSSTFVARVGAVFLNLGAMAILSRSLSPSEFGSYLLAVTLVFFGTIVAALGLENTLIRLVARANEAGNTGRALATIQVARRLALLSGALVGFAYVGAGEALVGGVLGNRELASHSLIVAVWFLVQTTNQLAVASLRGRHRLSVAALFDGFTRAVAFLVFVAALTQMGHLTLRTALLAGMFANGVSAALAMAVEKRWESSVSHGEAGFRYLAPVLVRESWPILGSTIVGFVITQGDLWFVSALSEAGDVGLYGATTRLLLLLSLPVAALHGAIASTIAQLHKQLELAKLQRVLRASATIAGLPAISLVGVFALFGDSVLSGLFGQQYAQAWPVLVVLGVGRLAQVLTGPCGLALMMTGYQRAQLTITAFFAALIASAAFYFGNRFGLMGVASTYAVGLWLTNATTLLYSRKILGVWSFMYVSLEDIAGTLKTATRPLLRAGGTVDSL